MTDRVVSRDGELARMTEVELESLTEAAFKTACWIAFRELGIEDGNDVESIGVDGQFGSERITACVKLKDGREASASAPLWPDVTRAN